MKIHILGAARTVTGSQYLLEVNDSRLLLECGLFQGRRADTYERNRTFYFNPRQVGAMILLHAHIDHCGNLPHLVKHGYTGSIYATAAKTTKQIILVHGEPDAEKAFVEKLKGSNPPPIIYPELGDVIEL